MRLLLGPQVAGRPFIAPPGLPAELATTLRRAFDATMTDPGFMEYTDKIPLEVEPVTGEAIEKLVAEIYKTPPAAIAAAKEAIK